MSSETSGFANVIANILSQEVPSNKVPILAKAKPIKKVVNKTKVEKTKVSKKTTLAKKKKYDDVVEFDDDDEADEVEEEAVVSTYLQQKKRKEWEDMCLAEVNIFDKEKEKKLMGIGRRGVVALFEAVRKQQATIESKVAGARTTSKAEMAVASAVDKGKFLDMLKAKKKKVEKVDEVKEEPMEAEEEESVWGVLRDNYITNNAKMKDWADKSDDSDSDD